MTKIGLTKQEEEWLMCAQGMAHEAGEVLKGFCRRRDLSIEDKGNAYDIVTEADKGSERIILNTLHTRFPDHAILSEESGDDHRPARYQWVIDPLDGTVNYSAGIATYCISIGLKVDGETRMGYVYAPTLDEEFWAIKGKGACKLYISQADLATLGAVRGTNEKKALYEITFDNETNTSGTIKEGGMAAAFRILDGLTAGTQLYGQPATIDMPMWGNYEVSTDEGGDYFKRNMIGIKGTQTANADLVAKNGMQVIKQAAAT